jgi:hypothetical protein
MSTVEMIFEKAKRLPENLQAETLHYVDFLLTRREAEEQNKEWARFSASQLDKQYAPEDSVYDND